MAVVTDEVTKPFPYIGNKKNLFYEMQKKNKLRRFIGRTSFFIIDDFDIEGNTFTLFVFIIFMTKRMSHLLLLMIM